MADGSTESRLNSTTCLRVCPRLLNQLSISVVGNIDCYIICDCIVSSLVSYTLIFSRYATIEELYQEAISFLKRDVDTNNTNFRDRALDHLRLVTKLDPKSIKPYIALSKELLYGEINNRPSENEHHSTATTSIRCRRELLQHLDSTSSEVLTECKEVIRKGLVVDPTNESLLKLQSELNLVTKYGKNNVQTRMMNVGSFGWNAR